MILLSDYAVAGIVVYTQYEYSDPSSVSIPIVTASEKQLSDVLAAIDSGGSVTVVMSGGSEGDSNAWRSTFESWWANLILTGLGVIAIANIGVASYKLHYLTQAVGCGFTIAHVCLSIHLVTNLMRLNVFVPPVCLCRSRLVGFVFNSLPSSLTLISTVLLIFYFVELTSNSIGGARPSRVLKTRMARVLFGVCTFLFLGFDLTMTALQTWYIGDPSVGLIVYGVLYAIILLGVAVGYIINAKRLMDLREIGRRLTSTHRTEKKEADPSRNALYAAGCMISLTIVLGLVVCSKLRRCCSHRALN